MYHLLIWNLSHNFITWSLVEFKKSLPFRYVVCTDDFPRGKSLMCRAVSARRPRGLRAETARYPGRMCSVRPPLTCEDKKIRPRSILLANPIITDDINRRAHIDLTRHRLGCFCTHHSLGVGSDPRTISKTDGRRETDEAAFERSRRDASKPLSKI